MVKAISSAVGAHAHVTGASATLCLDSTPPTVQFQITDDSGKTPAQSDVFRDLRAAGWRVDPDGGMQKSFGDWTAHLTYAEGFGQAQAGADQICQ